jgi:small subunit ribosomal protein S3
MTDLLRWFRENHPNADVGRVEREGERVIVYSARPGILIGRQGAKVIAIKEDLVKMLGAIHLEIREIRTPEAEPLLVATSVLRSIDVGIAPERAVEKALKNIVRFAKAGGRVRVGDLDRKTDDFSEGGAYASEEMNGRTCEVWIAKPSQGEL